MTIKTQQVDGKKRIIVKDVNGQKKVSCTCCETGCCMYPAAGLGTSYQAADLPDALTINWTNRFSGSLNKSGSGYAGSGVTLQVVSGSWQLEDSEGAASVGSCLVRGDGNLTQENDLVEDQFPDELNREGAIGPAARVSLCQWCLEGDELNDGAFSVVYFDGQQTTDCNGRFFPTSLTPHRWYLAPVGDGFYRKTGDQNTPIGTYEAVNTPGLTQEIT